MTKEQIAAYIAEVNAKSAEFKENLKTFKEGMHLLKNRFSMFENKLEETESKFLLLTAVKQTTVMKVMDFRTLDRTG
ncbi:hypothetical protein [Desertivirga arenae]|uniref:hypothetical protein n=1 Tax=Desertivirga arenae TaxID=2810309 RepID=UPI001A96D8CB|nr:hypothetical protein [Pedobacter sp. SYSU D00823]